MPFPIIWVCIRVTEAPIVYCDLSTFVRVCRRSLTWLTIMREAYNDSYVPLFVAGFGIRPMILCDHITGFGIR